jgi:hypothetical protein
MQDEFMQRELVAGEMSINRPAEPAPEWPQPWRPVPVDWGQEERERLAREHEERALEEELPGIATAEARGAMSVTSLRNSMSSSSLWRRPIVGRDSVGGAS